MTVIELLTKLKNSAIAYRNDGVVESITRNRHMNEYRGEKLSQETVDAILVDFINYVAMQHGVDYGLYTHDLPELPPKELPVKIDPPDMI
jgi:hypothetical protein